ncbi:MAG: leucyl aminopeptidase [Polyangiales bacterium]
MKIRCAHESCENISVDLLVVGIDEAALKASASTQASLAALGPKTAAWLLARVQEEGFKAGRNELLKLSQPPACGAAWLLLVGLGGKADASSAVRRLAQAGVQAAKHKRSMALLLPQADLAVLKEAACALHTGGYRYTRYLSDPAAHKRVLKEVLLLAPGEKASSGARSAVQQGSALGESINMARDWVNAPPNDLNPVTFAAEIKRACDKHEVACRVWNKKQIEKADMQLFLAVNRGSAIEPRLVHMHYKPKGKARAKVALVGKGLTFDAGGLCLKPAKSMLGMKCDMAGAAVTAATVLAAARLQLPVEVHGVIGATENMTGAAAYRPGDVFPSLVGKSVEIINTDAEGRLVLADVLAWSSKLGADVIVDHATLTGACMVALGPWSAGLYANDEALGQAYAAAATAAGESMWRMPLDEALREGLKSDIADLKHTGESYGGSISAALFLREFIGKHPWVHLDIAGPAFLDRSHDLWPKGGTGFGVATAVAFLAHYTPPKGKKTTTGRRRTQKKA